MNRSELAGMMDHTLLRADATEADVARLVTQGVNLGVYAVCVNPSLLPLDPKGLVVAAVCGFPLGAHSSAVKAAEAAESARDGANEIDMVIDLGLAKAGDWEAVRRDIETVRRAIPESVLLKVIIESAILSDEEIVLACEAAVAGGGDFVKTSTGFHPAGGASVHAVRLMRSVVGDALGVKASGGIRDLATALAMVEAGASRLGVSASAAILAEFDKAQ